MRLSRSDIVAKQNSLPTHVAKAPSQYASNMAPATAFESAMPDFDCQPHLRGEPLPVAFGNPKEEEDLEFELWVETDIDAAWCLPGDEDGANQAAVGDTMWRQDCTTSTMRRTWDDFELLDKPSKRVGDFALQEAMKKLGLPLTDDVDAEKVASAFRHLSLTCHPDKVTAHDKTQCVEDFHDIVSAYHVARRALADNKPRY